VKHKQRDEKAFMSSQPEREAKMEKKRKNREWNKTSKEHLPKTCQAFTEGEERGCSNVG
jgi:hypothetical protein